MNDSPGDDHQHATTLLRQVMSAHPEGEATLGAILAALHTRAFGLLLMLLAIPNFIPLPFGIGGLMGVLIVLMGLQMLCGLERPLLPARWRRRVISRNRVDQMLDRSSRITRPLERCCKPRLEILSTRPWSVISGLALVILGTLLAIPIPFTNFVFGAIMLAFAFALTERDGILLLAMWLIAAVLLILSIVFSQSVIDAVHNVYSYFL